MSPAGAVLGTAQHPTTPPEVLTGIAAVTAAVHGEHAEVLACSSAGGGLRLAVVGQERLVSAEAALPRGAVGRAPRWCTCPPATWTVPASGRSARRGRTCVLLAGGTDGGDARVLLHNARRLGREPDRLRRSCWPATPTPATEALTLLLATGRTVVVDRQRAAGRRRDWRPARPAPRSARCSWHHVIGGKGLSRGPRFRRLVRAVTPDAVLTGVAGSPPCWPTTPRAAVLVVDVGGATTDVYSAVSTPARARASARSRCHRTGAPSRATSACAGRRPAWSPRRRPNASDHGETSTGRSSRLPAPQCRLDPDRRLTSAEVDARLAGAGRVLAMRRHLRMVDGRLGPKGAGPARAVRRRLPARPPGWPRSRHACAPIPCSARSCGTRRSSSTGTTCWPRPACWPTRATRTRRMPCCAPPNQPLCAPVAGTRRAARCAPRLGDSSPAAQRDRAVPLRVGVVVARAAARRAPSGGRRTGRVPDRAASGRRRAPARRSGCGRRAAAAPDGRPARARRRSTARRTPAGRHVVTPPPSGSVPRHSDAPPAVQVAAQLQRTRRAEHDRRERPRVRPLQRRPGRPRRRAVRLRRAAGWPQPAAATATSTLPWLWPVSTTRVPGSARYSACPRSQFRDRPSARSRAARSGCASRGQKHDDVASTPSCRAESGLRAATYTSRSSPPASAASTSDAERGERPWPSRRRDAAAHRITARHQRRRAAQHAAASRAARGARDCAVPAGRPPRRRARGSVRRAGPRAAARPRSGTPRRRATTATHRVTGTTTSSAPAPRRCPTAR